MTINLTDPANHPASGPLTVERIERVIEALQRSIQYQNGGDMAYVIADAIKGLEELLVSKEAASKPVGNDELDQMIWKLERDGMTPKMLSLMRELREVRKASAEKLNQPVSETELLPPGYLLGHQDGLEWAAQMAEANHPQTGDWLHDDPIALAAAIRKGPDLSLASGNPPEIPDGYVMVPMRLMAENGAKGALSGEFSETKFINCPECFGDDECETCDGSGRIKITTPVSWTTIKAIWSKGVEHFAIAAPQEVG